MTLKLDDSFLKQISCCISSDKHFVNNPILLQCNGNACKTCILNLNCLEIKCNYCQKFHNLNAIKHIDGLNDGLANSINGKYLNSLFQILKESFQQTFNILEG